MENCFLNDVLQIIHVFDLYSEYYLCFFPKPLLTNQMAACDFRDSRYDRCYQNFLCVIP